eukprot:1190040-Prorocentrum_minimum.AAC.1
MTARVHSTPQKHRRHIISRTLDSRLVLHTRARHGHSLEPLALHALRLGHLHQQGHAAGDAVEAEPGGPGGIGAALADGGGGRSPQGGAGDQQESLLSGRRHRRARRKEGARALPQLQAHPSAAGLDGGVGEGGHVCEREPDGGERRGDRLLAQLRVSRARCRAWASGRRQDAVQGSTARLGNETTDVGQTLSDDDGSHGGPGRRDTGQLISGHVIIH